MSGGAGEHIITLKVDELGYSSRVVAGTPPTAVNFSPPSWRIRYRYYLRGVGPENAEESSANIIGLSNQSGTYGTTNIVFPGFSDNILMARSLDTGAENLLFFG